MAPGQVNPSSLLFDMVDLLERDRRSGAFLGLAHYLARFPGHEEDVAREYLRILDLPLSASAMAPASDPAPPSAESARPSDVAETGLLGSSSTPFDEQLRHLAAPLTRGTRFRRDEVLARGGMGVIHRVRDVELDRTLALKEMALAPADEHELEAARFLEEAQITAQLDHPGIVPVHEVGMDAEGRLFFAMKLVRGRDLRTILELARPGSEGWTQPRMLGVLLKVCEAMAYAHTKGVIHRDLKPGNVMVGHFGEVYVMDWGLARATGRKDVHDIRLKLGDQSASVRTERRDEREETPDSPLVTMDGVVVGTPAYMSPEQARGDIQLLSPRSDVYSIGAMLYHLLTGQTPYVPSGARMSKYTVLARVIEGPPSPMQELVRDVPAELVAICEKAMAREPKDRYADTLELGDDLRAYLEGRVVRAHETGAVPELRKWIGRNKGLAIASAAALLALVGGFATSSSLYVNAAERSTEVLRLSALQDLDDLTREADTLWPVGPGSQASFQSWLDRAHGLLDDLPEYEAKLAELERTGTSANRWWRSQLEKLVSGLEALANPEHGLIAGISAAHGLGVERRLRLSDELVERLRDADSTRLWAEASASIRDPSVCPRYRGLELAPQHGLLPLGLDPRSGLWEFAHLPSGTPAQRTASGALRLTEDTGLVLVLVPGGKFWIGAQADDPGARHFVETAITGEAPVHEVELEPFFISKFEMTQSQWERFAGINPSTFLRGPLFPVESVTWYECQAIAQRLGLVLPTEAQWEYACRAGTDTAWWSGDVRESLAGAVNLADAALLRDRALIDLTDCWFEEWLDDGASVTCEVGTYTPNPFGLFDVHGNVTEWCRDLSASYACPHARRDGELYPCSEESVPLDATESRSIRGGSWENKAELAVSSFRGTLRPETRGHGLGLRPARMIQ